MLLAIPFLLVTCLALPALGWLGLRQAKSGGVQQVEQVPVTAVALQIAVTQTVVLALALLAVYGADVAISFAAEISPLTFGLSWLILGGILAVAYFEARTPLGADAEVRRRLRKISSRNPAWIGVTLYAGAVEELAYRGVLTGLLATWLGYWPGAAVSAVLFSLAHLSAGKRAVAFGIPFALAMQLIVFFSGGLLLAILVHAIYDLAAAWMGQRIEPRGKPGTPNGVN